MLRSVVVTGAAGFLGRHLVEHGKASGAKVVSVVRKADGADQVAMDALLADPKQLESTDVLVHAAAIRHRHGRDASSYRASNVDLVEALLRAAAGRVRRFVLVSSVGVYGFPKTLPINERTPFAPRTLYSETKVAAEGIVTRLAPQLGLDYTIVRPTIIYGPGDTNGMLDKLAGMLRARRYLLVGDGRNTLHHTYVDDVVRGIYALAESDAAKNDHFILAGPETTTLRRLGEQVAEAIGVSVPPFRVPLVLARAIASGVDAAARRRIVFHDREPPINNEKLDVMTVSIAFDNAKVRGAGFTPSIGYEEGITRTLGASGAGSEFGR